MNKIERLLEIAQEMDDALSSTVKIPHSEVVRLTVKDLIAKRNCQGNKIVKEFDAVIMYYLDEDEFKKYVIEGEPIE